MARVSEAAEVETLEQLLGATGSGDRQAFARLYELTAARLYPVALKIMRRREAADEILQEAFVLMWRKAGQYRPDRGQPLAWMTTVVRNCAIDRIRSETREPSTGVQWDESLETLFDSSLAAPEVPDYLAATLRSCLERLPESQRKAILLAYYYGLTHEELAARLDSPLGTVKSWVRRGLLQLRDCLEP